MGIHINRADIKEVSLGGQGIKEVYNGNELVFSKTVDGKYLKLTSQKDGSTIAYVISGTIDKDIYISADGKVWISWDGSSIILNNGEFRYIWNRKNTLSDSYNYFYFKLTGSISASGNCDSMINFSALSDYCYGSMFSGNSVLTTAPELPATTLARGCYTNMFNNCNIKIAPKLPATVLSSNCYYKMFYNCRSLTTAPELSATNLAESCYANMFFGCMNLINIQNVLPATILFNNCYEYMFSNCNYLTTAPELPATTLANSCYKSMFSGCRNLITAPSILPATTLASSCYYNMFNYCDNMVTAPELPATTLARGCYHAMFKNCSKLNYIKLNYTGNFTSTYFYQWVYNISNSGDFYYNGTDTTHGESAIPTGWTVHTF